MLRWLLSHWGVVLPEPKPASKWVLARTLRVGDQIRVGSRWRHIEQIWHEAGELVFHLQAWICFDVFYAGPDESLERRLTHRDEPEGVQEP